MFIVDLSAWDRVGQVVVALCGELAALEFIDSSGVSAQPGVPGCVRRGPAGPAGRIAGGGCADDR